MIDGIHWDKRTPEGSKAHADANANYRIAKDFEKANDQLLKNVKIVYDGINKDIQGNFEENVCVSFYWKERGTNVGNAVSFHQPTKDFKERLQRIVGVNRNSGLRMPQNTFNLASD